MGIGACWNRFEPHTRELTTVVGVSRPDLRQDRAAAARSLLLLKKIKMLEVQLMRHLGNLIAATGNDIAHEPLPPQLAALLSALHQLDRLRPRGDMDLGRIGPAGLVSTRRLVTDASRNANLEIGQISA